MGEELPVARTEKEDFMGTSAVDSRGGPFLPVLAEDLGIDAERYAVVGITLEQGERLGEGLCRVEVYAADKGVSGRNMALIEDYLERNAGRLPVTVFRTTVETGRLWRYVSQVKVNAFTRDLKQLDALDITEEKEADLAAVAPGGGR